MDGGKVMPAEKSETVPTPLTHCESPSKRTEEIARPLELVKGIYPLRIECFISAGKPFRHRG